MKKTKIKSPIAYQANWNGFIRQSVAFSTLLLLIAIAATYSKNTQTTFKHLTTDPGLASSVVYDLIQDRRGFMWFGTSDGLFRYDGQTFKTFRYDPLDSTSISSNWVSRLYEDRSGNIWIGTVRGGICKLDPVTEKFSRYRHLPDNPKSICDDTVFGICEDTSGAIWLGSWKGLEKWVPGSTNNSLPHLPEFIHFKFDPDNPNSLSDPRIWYIYIDQSNIIWIATQNGGLNRFDISSQKFTHFKHDPKNPNSISNDCVRYIYEDPAGKGKILWIGTKGGLNKFNKSTEMFSRFLNNPDDSSSLSDNLAISICRTKNGTLWIGTRNGLNKVVPSGKTDSTARFLHYRHDPAKFSSLSHNFVFTIFEDRAGVLWLGTIGGGVNKISSDRKKFWVDSRFGGVNAIFEDHDRTVWVGNSNGLFKFFRTEADFVQFKNIPGNENSLLFNHVHYILEDPTCQEKTLWLACYGGGLDRLVVPENGRAAQFTHFVPNPGDSLSINSECVDKLFLDHSGQLWIGTCEGLNLFNRATETFSSFQHDPGNSQTLSSKWVTSICQSSADSNVLWIGTEDGFNKFLVDQKIFIRYQHNPADASSLTHNYIQAVHSDAYNQGKVIWIGTFGGGLDKFDIETGYFTHFTEKQGLVNNTIASIVEDDNFHLWISTRKGISKFDLRSETFKNFSADENDTLSGFSPKAYFKNKQGEIYFGGDQGFIFFHPDSIRDNPHIPPVVLTDFKIFDKSLKSDKAIHAMKKIQLNYRQNFFSIEFASLDYTNPTKNRFAYILQGLDRDWVYSGNRNIAYYTDVKPGTYCFRVKGSNNDGVWNEAGTSIQLVILPPFWQTAWFYSLGGICLVALLVWGYYFRVSRLIRQRNAQQNFSKQLLEAGENERRRIANELHDSLGQNLLITKNEIMECLSEKSLPEICANNLKEISAIVSESINEVRQIASNLHPHQLERLGLTKAIASIILKVSRSATIKFTTEIENIDRLLRKELEIHVFRIIQEALNNVIKHASAKNILVKITRSDFAVKIQIKDDGKGFDSKKFAQGQLATKGLGLHGIDERVQILEGSWNIETTPQKGTCLNITIPLKG